MKLRNLSDIELRIMMVKMLNFMRKDIVTMKTEIKNDSRNEEHTGRNTQQIRGR